MVILISEDVGCSSHFLLFLQTPGGPHKEGECYTHKRNTVSNSAYNEYTPGNEGAWSSSYLKSSKLWKCKLLMHWIYALDWKSFFKCNSTRYINHQRYICHQWQTYCSNVLFPDLRLRQFYQDLSRKRKWLKEGQISDDFFEDLQKCTWLKLSQRDMAEVSTVI